MRLPLGKVDMPAAANRKLRIIGEEAAPSNWEVQGRQGACTSLPPPLSFPSGLDSNNVQQLSTVWCSAGMMTNITTVIHGAMPLGRRESDLVQFYR